MKIRRATAEEQTAYQGISQLHGWIKVSGQICAVEYLGEGKYEPNWEVVAPSGFHFVSERTHTILGTTQRDMLDRVLGLEPCDEHCGGEMKKETA
jgi:hypothetical protein